MVKDKLEKVSKPLGKHPTMSRHLAIQVNDIMGWRCKGEPMISVLTFSFKKCCRQCTSVEIMDEASNIRLSRLSAENHSETSGLKILQLKLIKGSQQKLLCMEIQQTLKYLALGKSVGNDLLDSKHV